MLDLCAAWRSSILLSLVFAAPTIAEDFEVVLTQGTNMAAAASPDRADIAIDLQGTLWRLPMEGGDAKALTEKLADARQPRWSPDGSRIAFHAHTNGTWHIWTTGREGGGARQITSGRFDHREPEWMPDGRRLLISSDRAGNYDIWSLDLESGQLKPLTTDAGNDFFPAASADGKSVAFVSDRGKKHGIYVVAGDAPPHLAVEAQRSRLAGPAFSPGGRSIAYVDYTDGVFEFAKAGSELKILDLDSGLSQTISDPDEDIFPVRPAWLSDNQLLYTADGEIRRRVLDAANSNTVPFRASVTVRRPHYKRKVYKLDDIQEQSVKGIVGPVVSPAGDRVAFAALGNLWIRESNGVLNQLTRDQFAEFDPSWSPDGGKLAYISDRTGQMAVWVRNLTTGDERMLAQMERDLRLPVWSPDGASIAYYQVGPRANGIYGSTLHRVDLKSGEVQRLTKSLMAPSRISFSPDGKTLVLTALKQYSSLYREGVNQLLFIDAVSGEQRYAEVDPQKALGMRGVGGPAWSPDGRSLAVIMDGALWLLGIDAQGRLSGKQRRVTDEMSDYPSWSSDSGSLVYLNVATLKKINLGDDQVQHLAVDLMWHRQSPNGQYVIHAGKLFDGIGDTYRTNLDIVIAGNKIAKVEKHDPAHHVGRLIDAADKTVIPGLIDMHVHHAANEGEPVGRRWLAFGVTTVRETGGIPYESVERREAWASGVRTGPRLFFAGGLTGGSRIHYGVAESIVNPRHLDWEMKRARELSYDMVKTYVRMPDEMQATIIQRAHELGLPVSSHEIFPAFAMGVDHVEHVRGTSRMGYSAKQSEGVASYEDVVKIIGTAHGGITPTLVLTGGFSLTMVENPWLAESRQNLYFTDQRGRKFLENFMRFQVGDPHVASQKLHDLGPLVRRLVDSGALVVAGTDAPLVPNGLGLVVEIMLMTRDGGLENHEALRTATIWAAEALGVADQLGTVEPGKLADLVIIDGDPLANPLALINVDGVVSDGRYLRLDELLTPIEPTMALSEGDRNELPAAESTIQ